MAGKIQNEDIKSSAELVSAGGTAAQLPNDDKVYVTANSLNKTLKQAIIDGDLAAGGVGYNYIANGTADIGTTGWATYADAAGTVPVDGTGGSPSSTFTRSTSSPIRGAGSFLWTKSANNRQGEGFSYDFTIADADKGKVLQGNLDYGILSGTFVSADMTFWIYDVTNAVLIQPTPSSLQNHTLVSDRFPFEFQSNYNSNSYRLICHTSTTSALAYTIKFDDFIVGPQAKAYGSSMTDWVAYTPTFTGFGTVTGIEFESRKVGDTLQVRGKFVAGTTTATEARVTLGFNGVNSNVTSADTTKIPTIQAAGEYSRNVALSSVVATPVLIQPSVGYFNFGKQSGSDSPLTKQDGNQTASSGETLALFFQVPILGWASSQIFSSDASTRAVVASYYVSSTYSVTGGTTINFDTKRVDTHGAVTAPAAGAGTWKFTAPVPGNYQVNLVGYFSTNSTYCYLRKNGTSYIPVFGLTNPSSSAILVASAIVDLLAGDYIDVINNTTQNVQGGSPATPGNAFTGLSVSLIQGPAQIPASQIIAARATGTPATATTGNPVIFPTSSFDTNGGYSTSTGRYTAPIPGIYRLSFAVNATSTSETYKIYKNAAADVEIGNSNAAGHVSGSGLVQCIAGDIIDVRPISSGSGTMGSGGFISFERLGGV